MMTHAVLWVVTRNPPAIPVSPLDGQILALDVAELPQDKPGQKIIYLGGE